LPIKFLKSAGIIRAQTEEEIQRQAQIESGALALNDAAAAEKKLSEERTKSALAAAQLAGTLATTLAEASEFGLGALESAQRQLDELMGNDVAGAGEQAVESRLRSIENQKKAIQAQITALQQSGVTTEAVTEQIAALTTQLTTLGAQANIVQDSLGAAQARDNETEAIKAQIQALQDAKKKEEDAARAREKYAEDLERINTRFAQSLEKARVNLGDKIQDIARTIGQDLADALEDAAINAGRQFEDSIAEGNFLNVANVKRDLERAAEDARLDAKRNFTQQNFEARLAYDRQLRDLQTQKTQELNILRNGNQAILGEFRNLVNGMVVLAQRGSVGNAPVTGRTLASSSRIG